MSFRKVSYGNNDSCIEVQDSDNLTTAFKTNMELFLEEGKIIIKDQDVYVEYPVKLGITRRDVFKFIDDHQLVSDIKTKLVTYPPFKPVTFGDAMLLNDIVDDIYYNKD